MSSSSASSTNNVDNNNNNIIGSNSSSNNNDDDHTVDVSSAVLSIMDAQQRSDASQLGSLQAMDLSSAYVIIVRKLQSPLPPTPSRSSSSSSSRRNRIGQSRSDPGYDGDLRALHVMIARLSMERLERFSDMSIEEKYLYVEGEEVPREERKGFCVESLAILDLHDTGTDSHDTDTYAHQCARAMRNLTGDALQHALAKTILTLVQRYLLYGESAVDESASIEDAQTLRMARSQGATTVVSSAWKKYTNNGQNVKKPGYLMVAGRIAGTLAQELCVKFAEDVWKVGSCDSIFLRETPLFCRLFMRDMDRDIRHMWTSMQNVPIMALKEGLRDSCNREAYRLGWQHRFTSEFGRALMSTARIFYERKPWKRITNEYPMTISVTHPWLGENPVTYCIIIMGRTDPNSRGMALFKNVEQFRLYLRTTSTYPKTYSLLYHAVDDINYSDLEDIQENQYEIAHYDAHGETYPQWFVKLNGMFTRGENDIDVMPFKVCIWLQAALRASVLFAEEFFDLCQGTSMDCKKKRSISDMRGTYTVPTHLPGRDATVSITTEFVNVMTFTDYDPQQQMFNALDAAGVGLPPNCQTQ